MSNVAFMRRVVQRLAAVCAFTVMALGATAVSAQSSWSERTSIGGDFRLRHEGFFQDDTRARQRLRFRARLALDTEINEDVHFGIRLASGDLGNPISTNQTMTDLLTTKPINLDRAFLTYSPSNAVTIGGGKFGLPVTRTQMTFDSDLNWEGVYQQFRKTTGLVSVKFVAAQVPLQENKISPDAFLFAGYGEVGVSLETVSWHLSIADYAFRDVDAVALAQISKDVGRNTNALSVNAQGNTTGFTSGFNLLDIIARATVSTGHPSYPLQLTANMVKNTKAATDEDFGIWVTAAIGRASEPGSFQVTYTFARVERDAALSAFSYSDNRGTNVSMHEPTVSYMVAPGIHVDFNVVLTKRLSIAAGQLNTLHKRTRLDARISF